MNLLGKIFLVSIFVMSLLLMSVAMSVYSAHRNYKQEATEKKSALDKATAENAGLKKTRGDLQQQRDAARAQKVQAIAKLENELKARKDELAKLETKQADLEKAQQLSVAEMTDTQAKATGSRNELDAQRSALEDARKERDAHVKEVVRLTTQLNEARNEEDLLKKRSEELGKDRDKADQVMRKLNH